MKEAYLLDMDGVIYREDHLIPGALDLIDAFRENGIPFLFLTNNSMPTPEDLVVKMRHLGVEGLSARHFYTSAMNTADFLRETYPESTAFVLGEGGLLAALKEAGIANDPIGPDFVIVGEGYPSLEKLNKAHGYLEKGARLVATNPDNWCPVEATKTRPGAGATAAYLEASTGRPAYYLGKPNAFMFSRACRRMLAGTTTDPGSYRVIMVGDTMETDIRGSVEMGLRAYLVLTGSSRLEDLSRYVYQPTRVLPSVKELAEEIRTGKPAECQLRQELPPPQPRRAGRHQTDIENYRGRYPRPPMTRGG
ncbi:MAG: HAD-IIA family hydrolase [Verrucomicrobiota bacterium]